MQTQNIQEKENVRIKYKPFDRKSIREYLVNENIYLIQDENTLNSKARVHHLDVDMLFTFDVLNSISKAIQAHDIRCKHHRGYINQCLWGTKKVKFIDKEECFEKQFERFFDYA